MEHRAFTYSVEEYGRQLTEQSHQTLYWLNRNGYLNNVDTEELLSRMITVPIKNSPNLGQRMLSRFFGKNSNEHSYVFSITLIEDVFRARNNGTDDKPTLKVVK